MNAAASLGRCTTTAVIAGLFVFGALSAPTVEARSLCEKFELLENLDHNALVEEYKSHKDEFVIATEKGRICEDLKHIRTDCPHKGHWSRAGGFVGHFKTDYCGSQCSFDRATRC